MWFDNPFVNNNPDNLALLLKNLGLKQKAEEKKSTTVDVWRGNYDAFVDRSPRITIIKKYNRATKDDIAEVKTLYPDRDAPGPAPRTLLCHHATNESGHVTCDNPGKCSKHRLAKPSAFEVSKLDECRTVIDLYQQGVMSGVINADQEISRDPAGKRYRQVEYKSNLGNCAVHSSCSGNCAVHQQMNTPSESPYHTSTRPIHDKQKVEVSRQRSPSPRRQRARSVSPDGTRAVTGSRAMGNARGCVTSHVADKHVRFREQVLVKCGCTTQCDCGWRKLSGPGGLPACEIKKITCSTISPDTHLGEEPSGKVLKEGNEKCGQEVKLLPPCYYQHARQRMKRLKEKSKTIMERTYSAPSSLARPKSNTLVKKYNSARQTSMKRQKFVIPNVSPDCLYQPTKPKRPKSAPALRGRYEDCSKVQRRPQTYQIQECDGYGQTRRRKSKKSVNGVDRIKVAVDKIGPLVYAVQNGEITRMKIDKEPDSCQMTI